VKGFLAGEDVDSIIGSYQHVDELAVSIFKVEVSWNGKFKKW